jgi:DNA-binding GntR family transcriptional regulator
MEHSDRHTDVAADDLPLQRTTTAEQVAQALRDRILSGRLRPGTRLREQTLAESLGVSRNTLREALSRLHTERLLDYEVHRGVSVHTPSPRDIRELMQLRRLIEHAALAACSEREGRGLVALAESATLAAAAEDEAAIVEADMRFHERLVAALGNRRLEGIYRGVLVEMQLALFLLGPDQPQDWPALQLELSRRLAAGDGAAAAAALTELLDALDESLRRRLTAT